MKNNAIYDFGERGVSTAGAGNDSVDYLQDNQSAFIRVINGLPTSYHNKAVSICRDLSTLGAGHSRARGAVV